MVWECLRSWSLKGDRRGPVGSPGGNGLEGCFEGTVTGSLSESPDKPVSFCTRSLKEFVSACTKVVAVGEFMELVVLECFSIRERMSFCFFVYVFSLVINV
ncbi:hypothetical protein SO802_003651 [Lithocarpus litseifolius]|uniref:Uncharacterized protein n=1 Tax=Lithocarpus litseifolius TaxID=425828 RepID=A0AAW2E0M6_9ROSI